MSAGIDNSEAQWRTAHTLQREYGLEFPLLHGNAEAVPFPDAGFDLVTTSASVPYCKGSAYACTVALPVWAGS